MRTFLFAKRFGFQAFFPARSPTPHLSQTYQFSTRISSELERNSNEKRYQANGKQLEAVAARQGLVCSDPDSFFQDHNKPTKNPLCVLSAFAVQQ